MTAAAEQLKLALDVGQVAKRPKHTPGGDLCRDCGLEPPMAFWRVCLQCWKRNRLRAAA